MTRRDLVAMAAAGYAPTHPFRLAVCSETFPGVPFPGICRAARRTGYGGLEIDPSNLGEDPAALPPAERRELRDRMLEAGIDYVGLHSFLKTPKGLHVSTPDNAVRARSWDYVRRLIDLCADLGERAVMVMGSARQRGATGGSSPADAARRIEEGLTDLAPSAASRRVTILLEPLAPHLCDVINSLDEAVAIVKRINSPAIQSMLDTHNTPAETLPLDQVIRRYFPYIRHVHLNELDGRRPGLGAFPFATVLQSLKDLRYAGWVSVEVFDFRPDGETVARDAAAYLRGIEKQLR
ncbi:MAG: sugar phosphate isomerase/epimerase family protein [Bryobacteraceae bacterium]